MTTEASAPEIEASAGNAPEKTEPTAESLVAALEALLFVTGEPITAASLGRLLGSNAQTVRAAIAILRERCSRSESGLELFEIAGGYQLGNKPEHGELIARMLHEVRKVRLSQAAMETLAIIAYRQPLTRAGVEKLRGVNVDGVLKTLFDRKLVAITGQSEDPGRPLLYGTTDEFLKLFGLKSILDLPPLEEYEEIARARAVGEIENEPPPDWGSISENQRESLEALQEAAERELGDLDARLKELKPPRVVTLEPEKESA